MRASRDLLRRNYSPAALIAFLVFVLSRPYRGIIQDAHIYMGRALADLDPAGVGRDLMFVHDGQFGFSLFRLVADAMVWGLGLALAAKSLAFLAALAWFFGIFAFARQFAKGATVWVAVIFTVLLPNSYGASYPLGFAELNAIPRPLPRHWCWPGSLHSRQAALALRSYSSRRRPCFIRSWRSLELRPSLPFSVGKTSAGLGYLRSVRRSRS